MAGEHEKPVAGVWNRFDGHSEVVVQAGAIHGDVHVHPAQHVIAVPRQLPVNTRELVGRSAQLARLDAALLPAAENPATMAVISGTAGVGKTSLAVRWASRSVHAFPDGQLYVDMRGYGPERALHPQEVLAEFLRALGDARPDEITSLSERAARFRTVTCGRRILLLLDNVRSEDQVRPLLPGAGACAVVITSRHRLSGLVVHHGAESVTLDELSPAVSVALLTNAIGARAIGDPRAVAALASHCAGLPLALCITAERVASRPNVPLAELAAELAEERTRLDHLEVGDDPRSAVRTVLSWSYQLLADDEARLFRAVGLHPAGSFDAYAAAALTGLDRGTVGRLLRALVRAHLLVEPVAGRFEAHDVLRAYARELVDADPGRRQAVERLFSSYLLAADQADRILAPHRLRIPLDGCAALVPRFDSRRTALEWLETERHNLVAMCRLEGAHLDVERWQLAYALRGYFFLTKHLDSWIETHVLALAACRRLGDRRAEATTRNNLGRALLESGRADDAAAHYERARGLFEEVGDEHGLHNSLANLASVLRRQGRYEEALRNQRLALDHYRRAEAKRNIGITLRSMARVEMELERFEDAVRHVDEALNIFIGLGLDLDAAQGFVTLGLVHHRAGDVAMAEVAYRQALRSSRLCGSTFEEARSLRQLGLLAAEAGAFAEARARWLAALDLYRALGSSKADDIEADLAELPVVDGAGPA